jgi:Major Facilitator Superfamily.
VTENKSIEEINHFIDHGSITSQQILGVSLCFLFNMLDGFDITAMAVGASPVSVDLALTPDLLGWIFSFALAGMMVGAMALAPVADVIGRRALIIISLLIVGVSVVLTSKAESLTPFYDIEVYQRYGCGSLTCKSSFISSRIQSK